MSRITAASSRNHFFPSFFSDSLSFSALSSIPVLSLSSSNQKCTEKSDKIRERRHDDDYGKTTLSITCDLSLVRDDERIGES